MTEHHDTSAADPVRVTDDPAEVEKVREMIEKADIAMVTTVDSSAPHPRLTSRPLSTQRAQDGADVLFLTRRDSAFARDIQANPHVNVAYASTGSWISLAGTAAIVDDRALVEELWSKGADMFMDGGPENPDNIVVRVSGDTAEYWGGKGLIGGAVSMIRAMTGNKGDEPSATVVELP